MERFMMWSLLYFGDQEDIDLFTQRLSYKYDNNAIYSGEDNSSVPLLHQEQSSVGSISPFGSNLPDGLSPPNTTIFVNPIYNPRYSI